MKTLLCFAAHPDDLEFSCTGTIHKFLQTGYQAVYVVVTNGENGYKDVNASREERIATRKKEQLQAAERLGVRQVIFLDYTDGFIEYTENLRRDLVALIKTHKPEIIFSFDPANHEFSHINLYHRDHRILAEAVHDACFAAKNKFMYPGEPHRVGKLFFYGTEKPNYVEDVTDLMDFKLELLACHASQFADFSKVAQYIKTEIAKKSPVFTYSEVFRVITIQQIT